MTKKLIVIGVDGMDWDVIKKYEIYLPNISEMMKQNNYPHLRSVFPADTTPAWATIFTGLDPTEHGIINFINIGDKSNTYKPFQFDDSSFKCMTFWDKLNEKGKKCAVILPMNIKVGWNINGLMITRPYLGKMHVYPEVKKEFYSPKLGTLGSEAKFTSEKLLYNLNTEFIKKAEEEFRLAKLAIENEACDVVFSYFSVIDGIQHDFWRHCDENHLEYPGETEFKNVIRDMYIKIDSYIGEIIASQPLASILVISDHGHGARPVYIARINEMLKRHGYLLPKQINKSGTGKLSFKKFFKKASISFVKKYGLPKWVVKLAKEIPVWKGVFASSSDFDWDNTFAYLSDLSALKNYSYGGIRIAGSIENKQLLCDEIIHKLKDISSEDEGTPVFKWIRRTDELYQGKYLSRYPEIIFQLDECYGADWSLGEKLFEKQGFMHKLSPGSHRYETAVIMSRNFMLQRKQYEMTDIFPLIMSEALME